MLKEKIPILEFSDRTGRNTFEFSVLNSKNHKSLKIGSGTFRNRTFRNPDVSKPAILIYFQVNLSKTKGQLFFEKYFFDWKKNFFLKIIEVLFCSDSQKNQLKSPVSKCPVSKRPGFGMSGFRNVRFRNVPEPKIR